MQNQDATSIIEVRGSARGLAVTQRYMGFMNFVGYRIWATHKLLRKDSVVRARRKLRTLTLDNRKKFLASWLGHARHADTHNLLIRMGVA